MYTVAQAQTILDKRLTRFLDLAGIAGEAYNEQLAYATLALGGTVTNPLAVVSADLATVDDRRANLLVDIAEWQTLETYNYAIIASPPYADRVAYLRSYCAQQLADVETQNYMAGGVMPAAHTDYDDLVDEWEATWQS